jgi:hypothetical protein
MKYGRSPHFRRKLYIYMSIPAVDYLGRVEFLCLPKLSSVAYKALKPISAIKIYLASTLVLVFVLDYSTSHGM